MRRHHVASTLIRRHFGTNARWVSTTVANSIIVIVIRSMAPSDLQFKRSMAYSLCHAPLELLVRCYLNFIYGKCGLGLVIHSFSVQAAALRVWTVSSSVWRQSKVKKRFGF